jgi:NadR type nicotinamide-nucleotide adenylyltransferase
MAQVHAKRICLTGPESTGKTTLAQQLANELHVPWSAEYARQYAEASNHALTSADVEPIARGEIVLLESAMAAAHTSGATMVIHDTDLLSTVVYARHYYGSCPQWIEREARARRADLYLLLDIDVMWVPGPARDASDDARAELFDAFLAALGEFACTYRIMRGDWEARRRLASAAIDVR